MTIFSRPQDQTVADWFLEATKEYSFQDIAMKLCEELHFETCRVWPKIIHQNVNSGIILRPDLITTWQQLQGIRMGSARLWRKLLENEKIMLGAQIFHLLVECAWGENESLVLQDIRFFRKLQDPYLHITLTDDLGRFLGEILAKLMKHCPPEAVRKSLNVMVFTQYLAGDDGRSGVVVGNLAYHSDPRNQPPNFTYRFDVRRC